MSAWSLFFFRVNRGIYNSYYEKEVKDNENYT